MNFDGEHYQIDEMAMEPKPPQGGALPIWLGGTKEPMLRRVAEIADGWMAMTAPGDPPIEENVTLMRELLDEIGRDPSELGMQMSLSPGALDKEKRKRFYAEPGLLLDRIGELNALGFDHTAMDCVPIFQQGKRSVPAMLDYLAEIFETLAPELTMETGT